MSVVFDSDLAEKPEVGWAEWHLAETLRAAGAEVRAVRLPPGPGGVKVGVDDFLLAHGPDALRHPYAGRYTGRRLWRPADRLADWLGQGCEVFAYFNNDQEANAVFDAAWLAERLGAS